MFKMRCLIFLELLVWLLPAVLRGSKPNTAIHYLGTVRQVVRLEGQKQMPFTDG